MKFLLSLPLFVCLFIPAKSLTSRNYSVNNVCESFTSGKIDAFKTLKALDLNIDDYSIGVNNTAKIVCT